MYSRFFFDSFNRPIMYTQHIYIIFEIICKNTTKLTFSYFLLVFLFFMKDRFLRGPNSSTKNPKFRLRLQLVRMRVKMEIGNPLQLPSCQSTKYHEIVEK